jgi:hypothetical protein
MSAFSLASETHAIVHQGFWDDGLITETLIKSGSNVLADTVFNWEQGVNGANPRVQKIQTTNEAGETRATTFSYSGS